MRKRNKQNDKISIDDIVGLLIVFLLVFISWLISRLGDKGQFLKFLIHDVFYINILGTICILLGLISLGGGLYFIISKKAADPKRLAWLAPLCFVLLTGCGLLLSYNVKDQLYDTVSYLTGNTVKEEVIIDKFKIRPTYTKYYRSSYEYTLSDGREFTGNYNGKGFSKIQLGATYAIHYLPKSKKLLSIERVE